MIVALDGTPLSISSGGLRRYTEELFSALRAEYPEDKYHFLSDQLGARPDFFDRKWWSIGLPRRLVRLHCDVFHGTNFSVPYFPIRPSVMTLHDISPWRDPAWHHGAQRVRRRTPYLIGLGLATMLIVPTQAVRREAFELFKISPDRVAVVPEAAAPHFHPCEPYTRRPYFLFVGTVEPRKNVPSLVTAWNRIRLRHEVDLIIAGRQREDGPRIELQNGLKVLNEVSDYDLCKLYSGAISLVYPSFYEGFGLPPLEAMQCGAAVMTSRDSALVEVCGGAAVQTDDLEGGMELLFTNSQERRRRQKLSLARAAEFSWQKTARLTHEVYTEAIGRFGL